ncbi:MAG: AI-2E family transporter [Lachnoclostridium sp.]|jgi:predicted PurR-regulated permease PerM|nr:AI-2E family transporter [Lachnoclostridium sp.]
MKSQNSQSKESYLNRIKRGLKTNYFNVLVFIAVCTLLIYSVWNWHITSIQLGRVIRVMTPFIIALFLAYLIRLLINFIQGVLRRIFGDRAKKGIWVFSFVISYILLIGFIVLTIIYIAPEVSNSIRHMNYSKLLQRAQDALNEFADQVPMISREFVNQKFNELQPTFWQYGTEHFVPAIYGFSKSVIGTIYNIVFGIVISAYFIIDKDNLVRQLNRFVYAFSPKGKEKKIWNTIVDCNRIFSGFLIGKAIDSLIIGVLCFIFMSIFSMPYAILISMIVGVTNMIPYFGPFIGAVPGILLYLLIDFKLAVMFAVLILILQQFDGWYLGPKILGETTGIKPLWVIFAITVGGAYFGVLGMFLGVPVVAVISYLLNKIVKGKLTKKKAL